MVFEGSAYSNRATPTGISFVQYRINGSQSSGDYFVSTGRAEFVAFTWRITACHSLTVEINALSSPTVISNYIILAFGMELLVNRTNNTQSAL